MHFYSCNFSPLFRITRRYVQISRNRTNSSYSSGPLIVLFILGGEFVSNNSFSIVLFTLCLSDCFFSPWYRLLSISSFLPFRPGNIFHLFTPWSILGCRSLRRNPPLFFFPISQNWLFFYFYFEGSTYQFLSNLIFIFLNRWRTGPSHFTSSSICVFLSSHAELLSSIPIRTRTRILPWLYCDFCCSSEAVNLVQDQQSTSTITVSFPRVGAVLINTKVGKTRKDALLMVKAPEMKMNGRVKEERTRANSLPFPWLPSLSLCCPRCSATVRKRWDFSQFPPWNYTGKKERKAHLFFYL